MRSSRRPWTHAGPRKPRWRALLAVIGGVSCAHAQTPGQPASSQSASGAVDETGYRTKYFDVQVEGQPLRMAYRDEMPDKPVDLPPVVLLHGKNFSGLYWEPTIRELVASGRRVIAPDQIGFGASSKPNVHYTFHLLARLTAQLLDQIGVHRAVVVGHSMGGMLATRFALLYPERVLGLVLEDPIGLEDYRTIVPYTPVDEQFRQELAATYATILSYQKSYYVKWRPEYARFVQDQAQWLGSGEWPRVAEANALTYDMIYTQPVVYELALLRVPTLLIIGQDDRTVVGKAKVPENLRSVAGNYPDLGKRAQAAIPASKLVEIPGCGHIPHVEAHAAFMRALMDWAPRGP
jgi:pimeloyl-ACP methyl ester carboxylesterase